MTKKKLNTYTLEFKESAIKLALDSDDKDLFFQSFYFIFIRLVASHVSITLGF
jgi:hypothetical protein